MPERPIHAATRALVKAGFAGDGSLFTPERAVWTAAVADDLRLRFVDPPRLEKESFTETVERKLHGAPTETVQLLGELLFLHLLAPSNVGAPAKKALLSRVLAAAAEPIPVPSGLDSALGDGFANVGRAYVAYRDRQIGWLVRLVQAWKALPPDSRRQALDDPWTFRGIVDSIPVMTAYSQRNALLHLTFPAVFEAIVSRTHKQQIVDAFADEPTERSGDVDRDLLALRHHLEAARGGPVDFYHGDLTARWRPVKEQLPGYAPDLNPVEGVWSVMRGGLANLVPGGIDQLAALIRARLKPMQYRPGVLEGCLAGTGLFLDP
ncbi:hypothetical protein [Actinorugispora endophytica]|uniref:Uncharacterized protein n=1 Tax=Actinorugispora endophytica TaxID=1605990 RepID=A0A4R6VCC0_9ACTN|nr:hypothetical protein [Actinorugispora endophytica]TDQ54406.1 hypothetical protein EV190_102240 [Actinorugispora endophytica]